MSRLRNSIGPAGERLLALLLERPWVWGVPLALLLVNLILMSSYRSTFAGRADSLVEQVEEERAQLDQLETLVERVRRQVSRVTHAQEGVRELYDETFATEEERFTALLREVRRLAVESGLQLTALRYPESELEDFELLERGINFSVEGTYQQLRTFINFLELSDTFVVLQSLGLNQNAETLRINFSLTTLFSGRERLTGSPEVTL